MLIVSDIHGAFRALRRVAETREPIIILGDFLNFIDYRTGEGMVAELLGIEFAREVALLRGSGDFAAARERWVEASARLGGDLRAQLHSSARSQYKRMTDALAGASGVATYGNVDAPELLQSALPGGVQFVEADVVEVEGRRVGIVGGAPVAPLFPTALVTDEEMKRKLSSLGPVDILCTHVPPAVRALQTDVVTGRAERASKVVLEFIQDQQPGFHFFGDVHQPQASTWRVGSTLCRNVGYFRATGRGVRHL